MRLATLPRPRRITGRYVLACVLGFFGVVIAVDAAFLVLALRTFPGQVSVTPYEDGLLYNRHIAQQAAQDRLGWRAAAASSPTGVTVTMRDRQGAPLSGLAISGVLERPATETGKIELAFVEAAPGDYVAKAEAPAGGWDLTFTATDTGGRRFEGERRLSWP